MKVGGVIAAVAMLCGCSPDSQEGLGGMGPKYPKNTPIVISGGSITVHAKNDKEEKWGNCYNVDASPGQKDCYVAIAGTLPSGTNWLIDASTKPYATPKDPQHVGHVYIRRAQDQTVCKTISSPETCIDVTFTDGYDTADETIDNYHHGRSFRDRSAIKNGVKDFQLDSIKISPDSDGHLRTHLAVEYK
ncbi:MAG TPA: hypothetical protein VLC51_07585 [Nitrospira sp.]|nr:hypothetical protein [Nitrospira sp.]